MSKAREVSLFISHWNAQLPSFPKGTLWNFNWHHSMCCVLMSISQTVFNSLAACSLLTPTRNFKGALRWIPQSCIKNVNLGDTLTTRPCTLPNSNEEPDPSRQARKKELTMPSARWCVHLFMWPLVCFSTWIYNLHGFVFILRKAAESELSFENFKMNTADIYCKKSPKTYTEPFVL